MDEKLSWPKKGDHPFPKEDVNHSSPTWASLSCLSSINFDDSYLATAFKKSADMVIENFYLGNHHEHPDIFFLPITYLYRHSFELKIKHIINLGIDLQLIENCKKLEGIIKAHSLHPLWNYAKRVIQSYWPDGNKEELDAAERIIQEFHKIDQSGQKLRYTKDLKGKSTMLDFPDSVELNHLQNIADALFNFFEGCEAGLEAAMDYRDDEIGSYMDDMYR